MPRIILHADMDQFYAAVEIRDDPRLVGKPVIIGADPEGGRGRGVVSTASYEARRFGVHSALPISTAWKLCPQGVFLRGNMGHYAAVSAEIFGVFEAFTPLVEGLSLDEAFLDLTGSRLLFGDGESAAKKIKAAIWDKVRLKVSVGVATNKSVAKIASDLKKPDALVLVQAGEEAAFLDPLPLNRLWGIGPKAEAELLSLGLTRVGDLARYPLPALRARFGAHADQLQALALGLDERPVEPEHEAKSIGRETTFDQDTRDLGLLRQTLASLSEDLAQRLRRHGLRAAQLTLKFRWAGFETHTRQLQLPQPSQHGPDLFKAGLALMESFLAKDRRSVRLVGLSTSKFVAVDAPIQEGLFSASSDRKERVDKAMDQVLERWGDDALLRANQELREKKGRL